MRRHVRTGAFAGIVTIFLALVGLIGGFTDVFMIGDEVSFAGLMLILPAFAAGVVAAAPRVEGGERREMSLSGAAFAAALAAASAGAVFGLAVLLADLIGVERIRPIFLNVTQVLMDFVTFGRSTPVGAAIIVVISAVAGVLGGLLRVTSATTRRAITAALTVTILFGFLQRVIPIALDQLSLERDWLYHPIYDGLTWIGALVVAAVSAGVSLLNARYGGRVRGSFAGTGGRSGLAMSPVRLIASVVALALLIVAPFLLGSVISEVLGTVMVFALLGIGLNIVVGYAGLLDLGYVFFFALGAYSLALLTGATLNAYGIPPEPAVSGDLNFYVAIPIVMMIAAAAGLLVGAPVLRLRGDYLALVTLGLGEMVTVLVGSPWLVPLVGGPSGMRGITDAAIGGFAFRDPQRFYYLALAFVALAAFLSWRLATSRIGRAWTAMREDEQTADAMGISTTRFKLLA
ncbi:MAG TPA: branched-chain amino acid ABC transporter permease, partial [Actinomycetota bacterium]|nr:branched-chain amino acid ABC transporter permease [Actinomycetota bacterium]